jgi:DNA-binding CsgD family transcriptional regulator
MTVATMVETTSVDPKLRDLLTALGQTTDAMIAVGADLTIIGWNQAATELFGLDADEALGEFCHTILCWRDRCGGAVCEECATEPPVEVGELIPTREVIGRSSKGNPLWLNATTIVPPPELRDQCRLVHLVREVALPPELERLVVERLQGWSLATEEDVGVLSRLTPRETEVLHLLTEGLDGAAIANTLFLSPATVRNHIQHILKKLEVHSRTEAVGLALRKGRLPAVRPPIRP